MAKSMNLEFIYGINSVYVDALDESSIKFTGLVSKKIMCRILLFSICGSVYGCVCLRDTKEIILKGKEVILGLLKTRGGLTGYQINELVQNQLSHFYNGGFGMIYPTLKKLETEGLVSKERVNQEEKPNKNVFYITEKGAEIFKDAVNQETEPEMLKSDFLVKLYFGESLEEGKEKEFLSEELLRKKTALHDLKSNISQWETSGISKYQRLTVDYGIAYYEAEIKLIEDKLNELRME